MYALTALLLTACSLTGGKGGKWRSESEIKKLTIREITHIVEKWGYHRNLSLYDEYATEYFSEQLLDKLHEAETAAKRAGDDMFMDFDPWSEGQDPDPKTRCEIKDVYDITDSTATVDINMTQWKVPKQKTLYLFYTGKGWRIDDFTIDEDERTMRDFLESLL